MMLELLVIIAAIIVYVIMQKMGYKKVWKEFIVMFIGVLLFELMSEPMWRNFNLEKWAYLYRDVSWIITFGWVVIFFVSIMIVDAIWKKMPEKKKFWLYLLAVTVITAPIESMLLKTGIRGYAPILTDTFSGLLVPLTQVPIEVVLIIPIIAALVIGFYKYVADFN